MGESGFGNRESGIGNRESGIGNRESGIGNRESGIGNRTDFMGLASYRELDVWCIAIDLVAEVYRVTATFPSDEKYGLISQLRRAAVSIPSNIAEGYGRGGRREYVRALRIARGSLAEVETQLVVCARVGLGNRETLGPSWQLTQRVGAMLTAQIRALRLSKAPEPESPPPDSRFPTPDSRSSEVPQ